MKVTNIKQQVKRQDRYAIYIDGKYELSFGESELLSSGLSVGTELTKQDLEQLKNREVIDKSLDRTLRFVALRPRSEWEVRSYLKRKQANEKTIDVVMDKLSQSGFIDDEAFAKAWVANRRLLKPMSKRRLIAELRQKRVAGEIIDKVLLEDEVTDIASLQQLIAKKRSRYKDDIKFMQYLARQGYSYQDVKEALNKTD